MQQNDKNFKNVSKMPRERLLRYGVERLTDAELIALVFRTGSHKRRAIILAQELLAKYNNSLRQLSTLGLGLMHEISGLGTAKSSSLIACFELSRRLSQSEAVDLLNIESSKDVYTFIKPYIAYILHEEFWVIYLNNSKGIISVKCLSKGGMTGTVVDIRILLKQALEYMATGFVICHNHPSGSLIPSHSDRKLTDKVNLAARTLDLQLIDHLIVTEKDYFSFADKGMIT